MQSKAKVLILDDDPSITELLSDALHLEGYEVMASNSPKDVLFLSRQFRPDVLLLDIMMPELDGFEVCEFFKRDPELKHTRIVILTARDDRESRLKSYRAKADVFLAKPFEMEELRQIVQNQAEGRQAYDRTVLDLQNQTVVDLNTVAFNRKYAERRITEELKRIERNKRQLGLILIHLELMKHVCTNYGFAFGNEILRTISEALRQELREFDLLARFNEDTFLVVLPDCTATSVKAVTSRARSTISAMVFLKRKSIVLQPLIVTLQADKGMHLEDVLQHLEQQLKDILAIRSGKAR